MEIKDRPGLDDPLWEYVLRERCEPYIAPVKKWWQEYDSIVFPETGIYAIEDAPPGLSVRFTRTAIRSPIKGVQAFPLLLTGYLQLSGVQGGANKMIERVCARGLEIDGITIIEKHNLPSTYMCGQFIAFVPTAIIKGERHIGRWVYFTDYELCSLINGKVTDSIKQKAVLKM